MISPSLLSLTTTILTSEYERLKKFTSSSYIFSPTHQATNRRMRGLVFISLQELFLPELKIKFYFRWVAYTYVLVAFNKNRKRHQVANEVCSKTTYLSRVQSIPVFINVCHKLKFRIKVFLLMNNT